MATLTPPALLAVAGDLEGRLRRLIETAASAKSKAEELLSRLCAFSGDAPGARAAYTVYLDTLEAWQGRDYAVMVVRAGPGSAAAPSSGRPRLWNTWNCPWRSTPSSGRSPNVANAFPGRRE